MRCAAVVSLIALASTSSAQTPPRSIAGLVRDLRGEPVAGATVQWLPAPAIALPWLTPYLSAPEPAVTHTDETGAFGLPTTVASGILLVTADHDRGALRMVGSAQETLRIVVELVATLTAEAGATMDVVLTTATGRRAAVAVDATSPVRLPAADYEVLVHDAAGVRLERVALRAGEKLALAQGIAVAPRLSLPAGSKAQAWLQDWPVGTLPETHGAVGLPPGPWGVRVALTTAKGSVFRQVWLDDGESSSVTLPEANAWQTVRVRAGEDAVAGAQVLGIALDPGGPRVTSRSLTATGGAAPVLVDGTRSYVAVVHPGHALGWARLDSAEPVTVTLQPGVSVRVVVRTPHGHPVAAAPVALRSDAIPELVFQRCSDATGAATFEAMPAGLAKLALQSSEYVAVQREIEIGAEAADHPWQLLADRGRSMRGKVVDPDGKPVAGALVTLRDTTGLLQQPPRTTHSASDGTFTFQGLLGDELCTLSAAIEHGGQTWSAQIRVAQPGDTEWLLDVRLEDPTSPRAPDHRRD